MSRANLEIVREAWKTYGESGFDRALEYFAEDCVSEDFPEMPDRATYYGIQGLRDRTWHFAEIWGDFTMEPVEFIDAGDEVVVAVIALSGSGKGSGVPLDARVVFVYELRDGKVVRDRAFTSGSEVRRAAGLSK